MKHSISLFPNWCSSITLGIVLMCWPSVVWGVSSLGCWGIWASEVLIPGSGYLILGDLDKALLLGGTRLYLRGKWSAAESSSDYESDLDKIKYVDDEGNEHFFLNQATWERGLYYQREEQLLQVVTWDLYEHACEDSLEVYGVLLAPFQIWEFGAEPFFWGGIAYEFYDTRPQSGEPFDTWHLGDGLSPHDIEEGTLFNEFFAGVGEEAFFRGVIQNWVYHYFSDSLSHYGAAIASTLFSNLAFAAAHLDNLNGSNATGAFLSGLYNSFLYIKDADEGDFNLTLTIAYHAWTNGLREVRTNRRTNEYEELQAGENAKTFAAEQETSSSNRQRIQIKIQSRF